MDLKKVLIGLLIGTLLFCLCNKIFNIEGIANQCPDKDSTCSDELKKADMANCWNYEANNWACGVPEKKCQNPAPFIWCGEGDTPGPPPPAPGPPPMPGPPSPALPTLSQSEIERECKNIKCPFENEKGDVQSCLTYMYKNGELVYECSADDENACKSGDDVYRNICTNDLFSRGIPQTSDFQKREIRVKNKCDRH